MAAPLGGSPEMPNLLHPLPQATDAEITELLAGSPSARVERITSHGQSSPADFWYDQDEDEWVAVLAGQGTLEWADGSIQQLGPGDWVLIPAHTRHRVAATAPQTPTVWLAVFWPAH